MSDAHEIEQRVRTMLAKRLEAASPIEIPGDVPLFRGGLGLDSMSAVELLEEIESEFDVHIDDDSFDIFDSLQNLVAFLSKAPGRR